MPAKTVPGPHHRRAETSPGCIGPQVLVLFGVAVFISAFLLFQVQPLIAKFILPWFGGSASVWTTCLLFFQVLLVVGYLYAHLLAQHTGPRSQAAIHLCLLCAAAVTLPIIPAEKWRPLGHEDPVWRILLLLGATTGLPYMALAANGPLVQAWFSRVTGGRAPYRLYAASNLGSLLALLSYPLLVEPLTDRQAQAQIWSWSFLGLGLVLAACAALVWRAGAFTADPSSLAGVHATVHPSRRLLWVLLPACASALLLASTNTICQDIAVVPFLWILPLSLYLLSFIIAFDSPRWYRRTPWCIAMILALALLPLPLFDDAQRLGLPVTLRVGVYAAVLFTCCMACHGELARLKPEPSRVTSFYLSISIGGAIGGLSVALGAPAILNGFYELHITLAVCCLLLLLIAFADPRSSLHRLRRRLLSYTMLGLWVALVLVLYTDIFSTVQGCRRLIRVRGFYGVLTVLEQTPTPLANHVRLLHHGGITHGVQFVDPARRRVPTGYYTEDSGAGRLLRTIAPGRPRRIGLVGLGPGTLAAYGRPGDLFRFYEINPQVLRLANEFFWYLSDCPATVEVVLGDARLALERQPPQQFDALLIDAFNGDAIPTHLLTRQAMDVYLRHLASDGALAFHVTNQHVDLTPLLAELASAVGLHAVRLSVEKPDPRVEGYVCEWILMAADQRAFRGPLLHDAAQPVPAPRGLRLWTDDYVALWSVLK